MRKLGHNLALLLATTLAIGAAPSANACAVCMGASDSPIAPAINAAIFLLLGFIGCMMASVGGFMFYLAKRARTPVAPHEALVRELSALEEKQHA
jgi:hypothetical protein